MFKIRSRGIQKHGTGQGITGTQQTADMAVGQNHDRAGVNGVDLEKKNREDTLVQIHYRVVVHINQSTSCKHPCSR
jgi:hypothetical protein